ncbi:DUF6503 family protein [Maribacter sp. 2210JD10-5]|uniref:DUF6503 family protein n=1 Tax=Maribacter sp. 2210JD10-5 TaxID=3386272 RepID=UPI0039BD83DA
MPKYLIFAIILFCLSCKQKQTVPSAQEIVDKSIAVSGGELYTQKNIAFRFRGKQYRAEIKGKGKILKRSTQSDSLNVLDVKSPNGFQRFINDSLVVLADTTANKYANAVNSVHYFAQLPFGLNDQAVNKRFLGKTTIGANDYYKVEITFDQNGGGDDFDDVYVYWFNTTTWKPDYLAYEFHVNGGGQRFREAYNERQVGGIRFVDYKNYKSNNLDSPIYEIDRLFEQGKLDLLSEIKLEDVQVTTGNYN